MDESGITAQYPAWQHGIRSHCTHDHTRQISAVSAVQLWSLGELECAMGRSPAAGDAARGIARHPLALRSAYATVHILGFHG